MAAPAWSPTPEDVADYVTSRTVDAVNPGSDTPLGTFTQDTYPTEAQVSRLIQASVMWVVASTGTLHADLEENAKAIAAMRTAALVELSYPERDADVNSGTALLIEARETLATLVAANTAAGSPGIGAGPAPTGSFPCPDPWVGNTPVRSTRLGW